VACLPCLALPVTILVQLSFARPSRVGYDTSIERTAMMNTTEPVAVTIVKQCFFRGESMKLAAGRVAEYFATYWEALSFVRREYFYAMARRIGR